MSQDIHVKTVACTAEKRIIEDPYYRLWTHTPTYSGIPKLSRYPGALFQPNPTACPLPQLQPRCRLQGSEPNYPGASASLTQ